MNMNPRAGHPADANSLVNIPRLITAYYSEQPDPGARAQQVSFGTSGHRGSSLTRSFNEGHILAITQAICQYRSRHVINGPLFLGIDTHALSEPAGVTALEVLAANGVEVVISSRSDYTPTPVISHAILNFNRSRRTGLADGIVVTPSHNPPQDGGFKYNPPHGGPAESAITSWIEEAANRILEGGLRDVKRISVEKALGAATTHRHNLMDAYVEELDQVVDMEAIREANLNLGVDPLGGAGIHYWEAIARRYRLNLSIVNNTVDPSFRFMTVDWDGKIRMDPSSPYAMQRLIGLKDRFDIAFACDPDHDRHGIVTRSAGLMPPNHYLAACVSYLFPHRPKWGPGAAVGKTLVSSAIIDRVAAGLGRAVLEMPVGFKWFVDGLLHGALGFAGEESAGSSFLRLDGSVWATDKDGIIAALLAAEITARTRRDPGEIYREIARDLGDSAYERIDAPATVPQKEILAGLTPEDISASELAGEKIEKILTSAPGNGSPIGGLKVISAGGWFAARPSGTEEIYKIYAESFRGVEHLKKIEQQAQEIVREAFAAAERTR